MTKATKPAPTMRNERELRLIAAIAGAICHARSRRIDMGAAGDDLEDALRIAAPGTMERLDELCPAPQMSLREWSELRVYGLRGLERFQERQRRKRMAKAA